MIDVHDLLDDQIEGYPRWRRGFLATSAGIQPTTEQHLMLYEWTTRTPLFSIGEAVPACRFVDGAAYVVADSEDKLRHSVADPHCHNCLEVELQHALSRS